MIKIFKGSSGLNTALDPARIAFNPKSGLTDLAAAVNITHDKSGAVSRRKGYSATAITDSAHSLWADGDICLFVSGTALYRMFLDGSTQELATVTSGARVRYCRVDDRVYYANGFDVGKLSNGVSVPWSIGTYHGPTTNRRFMGPPVGHLICVHQGRICISSESVVWHSESYADNLFDFARSFIPFQGRIRMLASTGNVLYVSDSQSTWAMTGAMPNETFLRKVSHESAIENTEMVLNMNQIGGITGSGMALIWSSETGIYLGDDQGNVTNLSDDKIEMPAGNIGTAVVTDENYITIFE